MRTQWLRVEVDPNRVRNDAERMLSIARDYLPGLSFKRPDRIGYYFNRDNEIIGMVTTVWGDTAIRIDVIDNHDPFIAYSQSEMKQQGEQVKEIIYLTYRCYKCSRSIQVKDLSA